MTGRHLVRVALRNLVRQRRRSILVGLAIVVGAAAVVVNSGFVAGIERQLTERLVIDQMGHLQVRALPAAGAAQSDFGAAGLLDDPERLRAAARSALPGARIAFHLTTLGMVLAPGVGSSRVALVGVDLSGDVRRLNALRERAPRAAEPLHPGAAYLGAKVASQLGAAAGDVVTVLGAGGAGGLTSRDVTVAAVLDRGAPWEDRFVYLALEDVEALAATHGGVQELAVTLPPGGPPLAVAEATLRAGLAGEQRVVVQDYRASGRFFLGIVTAARIQALLLDGLLLLAAALVVAGAQILSVGEREREIGAMMAVGASRRAVLCLFFVESGLLALVFGAVGVAVGAGATAVFGRTGVAVAGEAFRWMIGGARVYPALRWVAAGGSLLGLTTAATAAGLIPAVRASRLDPAQAIARRRK